MNDAMTLVFARGRSVLCMLLHETILYCLFWFRMLATQLNSIQGALSRRMLTFPFYILKLSHTNGKGLIFCYSFTQFLVMGMKKGSCIKYNCTKIIKLSFLVFLLPISKNYFWCTPSLKKNGGDEQHTFFHFLSSDCCSLTFLSLCFSSCPLLTYWMAKASLVLMHPEFVCIGSNLKNVKATAYTPMTLPSFIGKNKPENWGSTRKVWISE